MTDRALGFTVVLKRNTGPDHARELMRAVSLLDGVLDVLPHTAASDTAIIRAQEQNRLRSRLMDLLGSFPDPDES